MKTERTTADVASAVIAEIRALFSDNDQGLTHRVADAQLARADRLYDDRTRLAATLGETDPQVVARDAKIALARGVGTKLEAAAEEQSCVVSLRDREWALMGTVVDEADAPLPGLRVRLVPNDGSKKAALKPVKTDDRGRFRVVYHSADITSRADPQLMLAIHDAKGKLVFWAPEPLTPVEGSFTSVSVVLSKAALAKGAPRPQCAGETASGAQCKRLAAEGSTFCTVHESA